MKPQEQRLGPVGRCLSVAPMMERTDRHYRYFMRTMTKYTLLYTEMVTSHAVLHGDREYLLGFDDTEHPLVLQVGGDDPTLMAECARIAEGYGYDAININVGCIIDFFHFHCSLEKAIQSPKDACTPHIAHQK